MIWTATSVFPVPGGPTTLGDRTARAENHSLAIESRWKKGPCLRDRFAVVTVRPCACQNGLALLHVAGATWITLVQQGCGSTGNARSATHTPDTNTQHRRVRTQKARQQGGS